MVQQLDRNKDMTTRFIKAVSADVDDVLDNTCSVAEVTCWIVERLRYARTLKAENLTKEPSDNINNTSSQNYVDPDLTQDSVDTEFVEETVDSYCMGTAITGNSDNEEEVQVKNIEEEENIMVDIHDEIDLWELEQVPNAMVTEGQILEEFMLEGEIEFQGIDKCKIIELPDEQETEESIQKDELKLETPVINKVEISELSKEVKLEMPLEQNRSKLGQDVNMDSNVPTPFHVVPNRNILGKSISKLHARQRKVLG